MFGSKAKISSATSGAVSGVGAFAPVNSISIGHSLIDLDFDSPEKLIGLAVVLGAGLWAWRKLGV